MGANPTESAEQTRQMSNSLATVEDTLTTQAAEQEADEAYLGVASEGEIVDVRTENVDDDIAVEFELSLPNSKTGVVSFSNYDFKEGRVEAFLENIHCTVDDMMEAMYHTVPVTFTNWKGWVLMYGQSKHLETTFSGESNWYSIEPDMAHPQPNRKYGTILGLPFYSGVLMSLFMWSLLPVVVGFLASGFFWYLNCMQVGMTMPNRKHISVDE